MATLTIGTDSGGFFNFRGANSTPYAMGSSVEIATTGGDINISSTYEGIIISQLTFQASGYTTTSSLYGNIWNSSGVSETASAAVSAASDTSAPFGSKTFNLSDQYFTRQTLYAGYSRAAASPTAWDAVNGDNTTRTGNTAGVSPSGVTSSGTGTVFRRLVGTLTYSLYDQGLITRSVTTLNKTATIDFSGANGTHIKDIDINWGDGSTATSPSPLTVAASTVPTDQSRTYTLAGQYPIATTISYASSSVGIPPITFANTAFTVPGPPTGLSATAASGTSISLSWIAPNYALGSAGGTVASTGGSNGTVTYQLYRTPAGGSETLVDDTAATPFTDTGLANGTSYSYTVYATNNTGKGVVSNTATATTFNVPSAPQSLSVTPGTADTGGVTQAVASWSEPSSYNGSGLIRYEYSLDGTTFTSNLTSTTVTLTSLDKYASYTFYVRAVNAVGNSANSSPAAFTTFGGRYGVYNGTSFVDKYMQKYNGSTWSDAPIRIYDGAIWDYTNR